ncbi:TonB-dependent receptor [Bacteriovoracales bacterium]|nr:TonB-dependent receptor [Bacteriovoracales bacterium]
MSFVKFKTSIQSITLATAFFFISGIGKSQILVKAKKIQNPFSKTSIETVTYERDSLERLNLENISDLLNTIPGFHYTTSGSFVETRFRGFKESRHILVMIDGVPLNDPTAPGGQALFSQIPLDHIESIVVEKGHNSVSEGANAVAAVIKIKTIKNKNFFQIGSGSYGSSKMSLGLNKPSFGLQVGLQKADNISSMKGNNEDQDGTVKKNAALRLSSNIKRWNLEARIRHDEINERYDQTFEPEKDYKSIAQTQIISLKIERELFLNFMDLTLFGNRTNFKRSYPNGWPGYQLFKGSNTHFKAKAKLFINKSHNGIFGFGTKKSAYTNKQLSLSTNHIFYQHKWIRKKTSINAGGRYENSTQFKGHFSPFLKLTQKFDNDWSLTVKGSRTYTPPSLNQIYAQKNPLSSEKIDQFIFGLEKYTPNFLYGAGLFYTRYREAIGWEEKSRLYKMEVDRRDLFGTEWFFQKKVNPFLSLKGFLNITKGINSKGETHDIEGISRSHLGLASDFNTQKWFWMTNMKTFLNYKTATKNQHYSLFDTSVGHKLDQQTTLLLKVQNLFDESYFLKEGYQTKGRHYFLTTSMLF